MDRPKFLRLLEELQEGDTLVVCKDDFVRLIQVINKNNQIYNYSGQRARNNSIIASAKFVLPEDFDYDAYEKFRYTKIEEKPEETNDETEIDASQVPDNDPELPF